MADPATIAKVSKVAIGILKDEESRRKIILVIFTPLIAILVIFAAIVSILTSPIAKLESFFTGDVEKNAIIEFKNENDKLVALQIGEILLEGEYPMPVVGRISSPYGMRIHPITNKYKMHTGIDICPEWHSPIISIAPGTVVRAGINSGGYGQYVIIHHQIEKEIDNNTEENEVEVIEFYSVYAHLSKVYAIPNQIVDTGSVIGLEGGDPKKDKFPGRSTGHHLHFEIRTSMDPHSHVDPTKYIYANTQER